jgi:hypothetical protein
MPDKPNVVNMEVNAGLGDKTPSPNIDPIPEIKRQTPSHSLQKINYQQYTLTNL